MTGQSDERLDRLWLPVAQAVVDAAAHEVKDVLNGVSLNLEVIRSRSSDAELANKVVAPFATAAAAQLEILTARAEALLFLARPARNPADVAITLRHFAALLVPATKAEGGGAALAVEGVEHAVPTAAPGHATRLAIGAALLVLTRRGGSCRCRLERQEGSSETVVRFSHEPAVALTLDPEVTSAISECSIKVRGADSDLLLVFPGS